jgi:hypothetical protein
MYVPIYYKLTVDHSTCEIPSFLYYNWPSNAPNITVNFLNSIDAYFYLQVGIGEVRNCGH